MAADEVTSNNYWSSKHMPSPYDRNIRSAADVVEATTDCPKDKQKLYEACRDIKY
jgi:hypothetical protein